MNSALDKLRNTSEVTDFSFQDFFKVCLGRWSWFLISIVICVSVALLYIYVQQPVYERSEEILITNQDSGGGVGEISGAFSTMGLFSSNSSVNNELISLKSPAVMLEVIKRLSLDVNYLAKNGIKKNTLYGTNNPVDVEFLDFSEIQAGGFTIELHANGKIKLYKFFRYTSEGKQKYEDKIELSELGAVIKTPIGRIKISTKNNFRDLIDDKVEIMVSKSTLQGCVESYVSKLNADLIDQDADVIGLSIKDVSVQRAVDILNSVLEVYNENWVNDKNKMAIATSAFIDERLRIIEQELGSVDKNIAKYRVESGTPYMVATAQISLEKDSELDGNIVQLLNQLSLAQYMKQFLTDNHNNEVVIPVNLGFGSPEIEGQIVTYNELLMSRNNLVANSSNSNPLVSNYDSQLSSMRYSITKGVDNQINRIQTLLNSAKKEKAKTEGKYLNIPQKALPLLSEERQQKVKESLYLYLLQKREENELTQTFTAYNTRVITPPMGSLDPVSPRKKLILVISVLLGIVIPLGILYIIESSNNKVRSKKDLDDVKIPFAGEIPQVGKKSYLKFNINLRHKNLKDEKAPLSVVEEGKRDVVNEAFRVVRSNIEFMSGRNAGSQVIMLTSFNPGSGKSFISYNLGLSFALKGKKVLLVDCDLRHGSSSMYVGMPGKGLTNYLNGSESDWRLLLRKSSSNSLLSILPIGKIPPNPAELLEDKRLAKMVEDAKEQYDYILLDCPPVNIVVDTQIVGRYADRTLFVVRAGLLERNALNELDEFYVEKKFNNMSVILNGTEATHSRYYTYGNYQNLG